ncbi:rRNA maturation RNase YbeY [Aequorivita viscosa]|uniref:Endoribonuclease YbeY n=1 Tax=Aequorivita viscosa TaxID=797419 RepID=A0A1M6BW02_9FLAO|nr:rRNA maturation RNase YbeY [Aequorivita viscosa]SDW20789.1 rRNA maturation RNase YbeY [Aequorivita viscosa]SHI52851.1 rRNA maturation RNase YbeY [Aequorivita viscosa]
MIDFSFDTEFELQEQDRLKDWIANTINSEGLELGEISYVFCDDDYLHKLNVEFLGHDTLTDIISFDYGMGRQVNGEIFISVERVAENAITYNVPFEKELHRVIIHGILHYCGYKDKTSDEENNMRFLEDKAMSKLGFDYS